VQAPRTATPSGPPGADGLRFAAGKSSKILLRSQPGCRIKAAIRRFDCRGQRRREDRLGYAATSKFNVQTGFRIRFQPSNDKQL
jgi:hypothetical protein